MRDKNKLNVLKIDMRGVREGVKMSGSCKSL